MQAYFLSIQLVGAPGCCNVIQYHVGLDRLHNTRHDTGTNPKHGMCFLVGFMKLLTKYADNVAGGKKTESQGKPVCVH